MAYFARRIEYAANEISFTALIEIARKKEGEPIKFILYRFSGWPNDNEYGMIEFGSKEREKAIKSFPRGPIVYEERSYFEELNKDLSLPRRRKNLWRETTKWLYRVLVGGAYQVYRQGTWIKIGRENRFKKRREKRDKRLKFGNLGHIFLAAKKELESLEKELFDMKKERVDKEKIQMQEEKIERYQNRIYGLVEEMKYAKAKKLGIPFEYRSALRF